MDGLPIDTVGLQTERQQLVDRFNLAMGDPGAVNVALQVDFVNGTMPYEEMMSYMRFCHHMITTADAGNATGRNAE